MSGKPAAAAAAAPAKRAPAQDDSDDDDSAPKKSVGPYKVDAKGEEYRREAEKKLKGGFMALFSSGNKYEDAIELLEKAAAQFKMAKNWQEAGEVYVQCAEIYKTNLKEAHDEGMAYENAAKAFKNCNTKEALRCYTASVEILMENNKFSMAAKIWKEMGILQEKEHNMAGAMVSYEKASSCYEADNAAANANGMWIKVADIAAEAGDYKKAIGIYEKVSKSSLESSALRWSVKDYLFKALLCHFMIAARTHRVETVSAKLEQYLDMCPNLDNTREKQLIEDLVQDFIDGEPDNFADHTFKYNEISKFTNFQATVLSDIKKLLEEGNPEGNEVGM